MRADGVTIRQQGIPAHAQPEGISDDGTWRDDKGRTQAIELDVIERKMPLRPVPPFEHRAGRRVAAGKYERVRRTVGITERDLRVIDLAVIAELVFGRGH